MENKYHKVLFENINKTIERRTRIEGPTLGEEALYDLNGKILVSKSEKDLVSDGEYFSEILGSKLELVMCGGGHIGLSIYNLAEFLDWNITIVEDREEYCNKDRYPNAELKLGSYAEQLNSLNLNNAAVIIATRGHKNDKECLKACLGRNARYLGMIGSKTKVKATMKAITEDINNKEINVTAKDLEDVFAPIGLDIKAQTPQEIAISIVSQIIKETKGDKKQIELDLIALERISKEKEPFVVARIIEKKGSAPREVGSFLAVFKDESFIGTVGGGAVEAEVIKDCNKLLVSDDETSQLFYHRLSNDKASNLGMICGGDVKVLLSKFNS